MFLFHFLSQKQYQKENSTYQKALADTTQMYEKKIAELIQQLNEEHARFEGVEEEFATEKKLLREHQNSNQVKCVYLN